MQEKIKSFSEIASLIIQEKKKGHTIIHCHGVFDLLHPGHIHHLQTAKSQGDILIVSITPDEFVNKGPGRPAFKERLRLEQMASLVCVDLVVLNNAPDAVTLIEMIKPNLYVKGQEYSSHGSDVTGKISQEVQAVQAHGGKVFYTDDEVFSSSKLINLFFDTDAFRIAPFISQFKKRFSLSQVLDRIEKLNDAKVLVVGDAIIDEYQYVDLLGQSGKGTQLSAVLQDKESFLGGSLIIANHLATFVKEVDLITGVGNGESFSDLAVNINRDFIYLEDLPTLKKRRYVLKDGHRIDKLFETYSINQPLLSPKQTKEVIQKIYDRGSEYDLILVCDFGNGFINPGIIHALCDQSTFLAINTQINSGNRGYNVVTHYHRADFISLNEIELRFAAHDRTSRLDIVVEDIASILGCPSVSITRGVNGVNLYQKGEPTIEIPA
ncbi:MAG: adenylyltransferase/cytidyltransferase family protein [Chlamydiales bacterium]